MAFLTNFNDHLPPRGLESRGAIVKAFLEPLPGAAPQVLDFLSSLLASDKIRKAGGFSLMCGFANGLLAIVSNRTSHACVFNAAAENEKVTLALSNAAFGDKSWAKVTAGESLMDTDIDVSFASAESEEDFINRLFDLLNKNDFKGRRSFSAFNEDMVAQLQASIFIPLLWVEAPVQKNKGQCIDLHRTSTTLADQESAHSPAMCGLYGTTQQTIILFGRDNQVKFVERTLFNSDGRTLSLDERDQVFEFSIEACALQNSKN